VAWLTAIAEMERIGTRMLEITGYSNRLSVKTGETVDFKISSTSCEEYRADLVRIVSGDPNPEGPGLKLEPIPDASFQGSYPSRQQPIHLGSYGIVENVDRLKLASQRVVTIAIAVFPTMLGRTTQTLISNRDDENGCGFSLSIHGKRISALVGGTDAVPQVCEVATLEERRWYLAWLTIDRDRSELELGCHLLHAPGRPRSVTVSLPGEARLSSGQPLFLAASPAAPATSHFNGRLERPAIVKGPIGSANILTAWRDAPSNQTLACWDFAMGIATQEITDIGPQQCHGKLINLPVRGVTGASWSGHEMSWRHAPDEYAAIHFHEDSLYDCQWKTDFSFTVPADLKSGIYGARVRAGDEEDIIPFFVSPARGTPSNAVAVLLPTFTYAAYANHARGNADEAYMRWVGNWGAREANPDQHPEYGRSTYNVYRDGAGICFSSIRRPILTMRPGFLTFAGKAAGSGLRHFPADTHIVDWLEAKNIAYDIITDHDLHEAGVDLLRPYKAVLTGSHPEYHTAQTLDALQSYAERLGTLLYLGGNGFYWKIAVSDAVPDVIEVRRAEGGVRTWDCDPGEYYNMLDGEYGGLWRRNGRPPQTFAGIGFRAHGEFEGSYYRRTEASFAPEFAWMFEGVSGEVIGDFGLSGGGAAGFELDGVDARLGSPGNVTVLARSENHGCSYVVANEELLAYRKTVNGVPHDDLISADMTWLENPLGGSVFSAGSITFCGSLYHDRYENNISTIVGNVIARARQGLNKTKRKADHGNPHRGRYRRHLHRSCLFR
jgi:N,N-dimethylformamidase